MNKEDSDMDNMWLIALAESNGLLNDSDLNGCADDVAMKCRDKMKEVVCDE